MKKKHHVTPMGSDGLLIYSKNPKNSGIGSKQKVWDIYVCDSNLNLVYTEKIELGKVLEPEYSLLGTDFTDKYIIFYFGISYNTHVAGEKFYIIDRLTFESRFIDVKKPETASGQKVNATSFVVDGSKLIIHGYTYRPGSGLKGQVFLYRYDLDSQISTFHRVSNKFLGTKRNEMKDFCLNKDLNEYSMALKGRVDNKETNTYIVRFNERGNMLSRINLSKELRSIEGTSGISASSMSSSHIKDDTYIYIGSYVTPESSGKKALNFFNFTEKGSGEGIYLAKVSGDKLVFLKIIDFLELEELKSLVYERFNFGANSAKNKDKKEVFSSNIFSHEIMQFENKYYYIGELYYPTYTSTYDSKGNLRRVFDGYEYTNAIIICFDFNGDLIWNKSIDMYLFNKPRSLKKNIAVNWLPSSGQMRLTYSDKALLHTLTLDRNGEELLKKKVNYILTNSKNDKIKKTSSAVEYWYNNYLITFGQSKIKDTKQKDKRRVFYINKYQYNFTD